MVKVFIGCVTYAKDAHALPYFLDSLAKFDPSIDWDLCIVDTTAAGCPDLSPYTQLREECAKRLPGRKVTFLETTVKPGTWYIEIIARGRQQLREEFLKHSDYTHFLMVDSDMVFPHDTLPILVGDNLPVVTGVYLSPLTYNTDAGVKHSVAPVAYLQDPVEPNRARPLMTIDVLVAKHIPILISGFGVVLIRRDVIDAVPFPFDAENKMTEDTAYFLILHSKKIPAIMDTRVKCAHFKFPVGDERNKMLDFRNYQVQVKPKV